MTQDVTYNPQNETITLSGKTLKMFKDIQKEIHTDDPKVGMELVIEYALRIITILKEAKVMKQKKEEKKP